ncbi:MAG: formyltransferase family protein, partial [Clostridiales bacterium]|nr:formyltransferase family protein [Clostridiales bacterium]
LGMYNFHPSHLAEGKFPGPNPFQEMVDAGEDTTRMTVHEVDAGFDTGKVVGYSPEINIRKADGSYPCIPDLHRKTAEAAGKMAVTLIRHLISTRARCTSFDFEAGFSDEERASLMTPVDIGRKVGRVAPIELK